MVFILELILNTCSTIGICTIMYVIANQPITRFTVIVWGITGIAIRIMFYIYENRKKSNSSKITKATNENKPEE